MGRQIFGWCGGVGARGIVEVVSVVGKVVAVGGEALLVEPVVRSSVSSQQG